MSLEFRANLALSGAKEAAGDVAALRREFQAAAGDLGKLTAGAKAHGFGDAVKETAKGFDPKAFQQKILQTEVQRALEEKALQKLGLGLSKAEKAAAKKQDDARKEAKRKQEEDAKEAVNRGKEVADRQLASTKESADRQKRQEDKALKDAQAAKDVRNKLAGAAVVAAGGLGALSVLALGYRGMAQLQALTFRAQWQLRSLFKGVDPAPVVRAADRFLKMFDKTTVVGKALEGVFTRTITSLFGGIEAAQPLATRLVEELVLGGLKAENSWLKFRIALFPVATALGDLWSAASASPLPGLISQATDLGAGFSLVTRAIDAATAALNAFNEVRIAFGEHNGDANESLYHKVDKGSVERAKSARAKADPNDATHAVAAGLAGMGTGKAYADGVALGALDGKSAVEQAGGALAGALDKGMRDKGQIHSPSKLAYDTASNFPAGTAKAIDDGRGQVQDAADRSLVPKMPSGGGQGGGGGSAPAPGATMTVHMPISVVVQGGNSPVEDFRAAAREVFNEQVRALAQALGVSVELSTG